MTCYGFLSICVSIWTFSIPNYPCALSLFVSVWSKRCGVNLSGIEIKDSRRTHFWTGHMIDQENLLNKAVIIDSCDLIVD